MTVRSRLAAEWRPSASSPRLNGRRSARLAYTTTTWTLVVVHGRMRVLSSGKYIPRRAPSVQVRLQRGGPAADLELRHISLTKTTPDGQPYINYIPKTSTVCVAILTGRASTQVFKTFYLVTHPQQFRRAQILPRPSIDTVFDCLVMAWQ